MNNITLFTKKVQDNRANLLPNHQKDMDLVTYMETSPYRPLPWDARVVPLEFPTLTHDPIDTFVPHDTYEPFRNHQAVPKQATYAAVLNANKPSEMKIPSEMPSEMKIPSEMPSEMKIPSEMPKSRIVVSRPAMRPKTPEPPVVHEAREVPMSPVVSSQTGAMVDWADL